LPGGRFLSTNDTLGDDTIQAWPVARSALVLLREVLIRFSSHFVRRSMQEQASPPSEKARRMARKRNKHAPGDDDRRRNEPDPTVLDRVQELTWALLDDEIKDDEFSLLDTLLLSDDHARNRYVECVQLHVDLLAHYAAADAAKSPKDGGKPSVLGFLNTNAQSFDVPSAGAAD
jgi:hypothetical protein